MAQAKEDLVLPSPPSGMQNNNIDFQHDHWFAPRIAI